MTAWARTLPARRRCLLAATGVATLAGTVAALAVPASADTGPTSVDSTVANVQVGSAITLIGLTPSFTLIGDPGQTVSTGASPVTMTVTTNNTQGYTVTVQPATPTLEPNITGNTDSIPIARLRVRESGTTTYTPLSFSTPVVVHSQTGPSAEAGDQLSNDYSITIPFVAQDTYSATLNYIAATL